MQTEPMANHMCFAAKQCEDTASSIIFRLSFIVCRLSLLTLSFSYTGMSYPLQKSAEDGTPDNDPEMTNLMLRMVLSNRTALEIERTA